MNIRKKTLSATIRQMPGYWLNKQTGRKYKTAHGAQAAIKRDAKRIVRSNPDMVVISVITWESTTPAGRWIVKAIASE